ncbi:MAG: carbohydrate kinase family protein [Patescibacteria group bacterium]
MDFLAVGDIVVDEFIRLKDASVHCNINNEDCEICMRWGDKIPFESATLVPAVGNAVNAAVAAARLGINSGLRAYVGADQEGQECLASLLKDKVDSTFVERVEGKHTNHHFVLWYDDNRTILVKHEEFEYRVPPLPSGPKWLYLSSLGENSLAYHNALAEQLKRWSTTKLAFQPGTFQFKIGKEALSDVYKRTDIIFCNKEEAEHILGLPVGSDIKQLLAGIKALGPKIVVITDDKRGCYSIDEAGATLHCPRYPDPRAPFEITGAGDALASTTTVALSLGKSLSEALMWGSVNASAVLQEIGAQKGLLTREQLEKNLATPPAPFVVEPF